MSNNVIENKLCLSLNTVTLFENRSERDVPDSPIFGRPNIFNVNTEWLRISLELEQEL